MLGPIRMLTSIHVGLQDRRFVEIWGFQEAFNFSSFLPSLFYRFLLRLSLQLGIILGAKVAQNLKKEVQKIVWEAPPQERF